MVRLALTDDILQLISDARAKDFFSDSLLRQFDEDIEAKSLSVQSLLAVKNYIEAYPECGKTLSSCFSEQKNVLRFQKFEPTTHDATSMAAKKERNDRLIRLQETKEYNQMVFGSQNDPVAEYREKELSAFVSFRHQASVGANVIISAGGMGVVFYFLSASFFEKKQHVSHLQQSVCFIPLHAVANAVISL